MKNANTSRIACERIRYETFTLGHTDSVRFHVISPEDVDCHTDIVLIHGISRDYDEQIEAFQFGCHQYNYRLIVPVFDRQRCPDYQRLGRTGKGPRSDFILNAILEKTHLPGIRQSYLFGHSAGAQFAHRFALFYPGVFQKIAISASGWYTFPTNDHYPYGLTVDQVLPGIQPQLDSLLELPIKVFVGSRDTLRDQSLNKNRMTDRQQGRCRLERGERWVMSMAEESVKRSRPINVSLELLDDVGHQFRECIDKAGLHQRVIKWFFSQV